MADATGRGPSRASTFAKDILLVALVLVVATGLAFAVTYMSRPPTPQAAYNFSLGVLPTSGTAAPGDSATATVSATVMSGAAGTLEVRFLCADLPLGANCTFTPSSCRPTCSVNLVLSTSPTTPTGAYVVTIEASNATISRTTTFAVNVSAPPPPPFDYSLEVNPTSGTVAPGGRVSANVTASLSSGPSEAVRFACSDVPPETTCDIVPETCRATCNATLTLVTSANATPGTYSINVTATHGSLSRTVPYALTVQAPTLVRTLTFQAGTNNFSYTDDATIYSGNPNGSYGFDRLVMVDNDCIANATCRGLLRFRDFLGPNEGQVPPNSTIVSAILELNVTNTGPSQRLYQVQEAWNESTVTWNTFATPGEPRTKGPAIFYNATVEGRIALNITEIVQRWVNGDPNYGVFQQTDSPDGMHYDSSESGGIRPKLTVTFRGVGSPMSASGSIVSSGPPSPAPTPPAVHGGFGIVSASAFAVAAIPTVGSGHRD